MELLDAARAAGAAIAASLIAIAAARGFARARRRYVRALVLPYRTDRAAAEAAVAMFESLHAAVQQRWWRRLLSGQASVALELHAVPNRGGHTTMLAVSCPEGLCERVQAAIRVAYPNTAFEPFPARLARPPSLNRLVERGTAVRQALSSTSRTRTGLAISTRSIGERRLQAHRSADSRLAVKFKASVQQLGALSHSSDAAVDGRHAARRIKPAAVV